MAISDQLLRGIQQLTPLPVTVQRLATALGDEEVSPNKIADIVEYDGAVAANILRVANSATYGGRFRTERIRDAVVRLGRHRYARPVSAGSDQGSPKILSRRSG